MESHANAQNEKELVTFLAFSKQINKGNTDIHYEYK